MKTGILYLVVLFAASQMAAADGMSDAFGQGKAMGAAGKSVVQFNITAGQGASIVPNYSNTAPESSYFGLSALVAPAANKIVGCATGPKSSSAYLQQECDVVNFLNKNPYQRKNVDIDKNDPLLKNSRQIMKDPTRFANPQDSGIYSQCKTSTVTAPPTYKTDVCHSTAQVANETCSTAKQFVTNCAGSISVTPTLTTSQSSYAATIITTQPSYAATPTMTQSTYSATPDTVTSTYSATATSVPSSYGASYGVIGIQWVTCNLTYYMYVTSVPNGYGGKTYKYSSCAGEPSPYSVDSWGDGRTDRLAASGNGGSYSKMVDRYGYYCPSGGSLSGTTCNTTTTVYSCPSGGSLSGSTCTTTGTAYTCPNGGSLSGTTCTTTNTAYSCPSAPTWAVSPLAVCTSTTARRNEIISLYQKWFRRCADNAGLDYWDGSIFSITDLDAIFATWPGHVSLGDPSPTTMEAFCGTQSFQGPNLCLVSGGNLSGTTCTTSNTVYACPNGGTLSGTTCTNIQYSYSCPSSTTLNGGTRTGSTEAIYYAPIQPLTCASLDQVESGVIRAYKDCLGRCPDIPGLTWWTTQIKNGDSTLNKVTSDICAHPAAKEWADQGKPLIRAAAIPYLCDVDKRFKNFDQCIRIDDIYMSNTPISNAQCSGSADYVDSNAGVLGATCAAGMNATRVAGYTEQSTCKYDSGSCMTNSSTCTPGSTVVNGVPVTDPCMTRIDNKTCLTGGTVDDCNDLKANSGCIQQSSKCIYPTDGGACNTTEYQYKCKASDGLTKSVQDCGDQKLKLGQYDFDTAHPPDADFAKVIASMEMVREAGLYMDPATMQLFKGADNRCTKGYAGLKKCCKTSGGGGSMSNSAVFSIGSQVASNGASYAAYKATPYVYDALYALEAPWASAKAASMVGNYYEQYGQFDPATGGFEAAFNPSLSLYGITWTTASTVPAATLGTNIGIGGAGEVLGGTMYFNPYIMGAQIAIMVIQELISCTQDEQMLGMKRGQNLCHFAGSYCSAKIPIIKTCIETTESYCCFNSRLARIINEQGRGQLGKDWGSGESPNCSGFTADQLQTLDFGTMDLSEFYAEIIPKMPDTTAISAKNQQMLQQKVQSYYSQ